MSEPEKIRILCVDDHAEIRRLFELIMQDRPDFHVVGTSKSAEDLEGVIETLRPSVVVLDISMPGRNPLDAMRDAKQRFSEVQFLVSSSYDHGPMIERALAAGATGYFVKGGLPDEMAEAIRKVARGEKVAPPTAPRRRIDP